jgi:lipid A 3-O-deacylase
LPGAGAGSIDIFQTGVMQVMYTPADICKTDFQPKDYNYSGGLFVIHSLYSYNPEKKYDFQTELDAGIRGPAAFSGETQKFVHHAINYQRPMGWNHQLRNYPLLNISFTAEKQIASRESFLEVIAGGKISAGSQINALSFYPLIRIGKMNPYFEGYINQFSSAKRINKGEKRKIQFYFTLKPEIKYVLTNAMLEGEIFSGSSYVQNGKHNFDRSDRDLEHVIYSVDFGAVATIGSFGISFVQNISSMQIRNTYGHEYGNFSIYLRL